MYHSQKEKAMPTTKTRRKVRTVCDTLQAAILAEIKKGSSYYRLAKDSGVRAEVIAKFAAGGKHLRGDSIDLLCAALGLKLVASS
jgi:hypothetical protein